jgi:hypothetical protein
VVLGSILFLLILAVPLAPRLGPDGASIPTIARKVIRLVAPFGLLLIITVTGLNAAVLQDSLDAPWSEVAASGFVIAGTVRALALLAILLFVCWRPFSWRRH